MITELNKEPITYPRSKYKTVLMFCLVVFLFSCTKQVPGPKGDTGAAGGNGNAKLSSSVVFNHPASAWSSKDDNWTSVIYMSEITDQVLLHGKVRVYVQINDLWWPLPYEASETFTQFTIRNGLVNLSCEKLHGNTVKPISANYRVSIVY